MPAPCRLVLSIVARVCLLVAVGCPGPSGPAENPAAGHLRLLCQAYDVACYKLGHPPRDANELRPHVAELLKGAEPDSVMVSPNDGMPYEVVWGVNLERETNGSNILAFESKGVEGSRHVISVARIVKTMTDAEFASAGFPKGKK